MRRLIATSSDGTTRSLCLSFRDMDLWPYALELKVDLLDKREPKSLILEDKAPFGAENLMGGDIDTLIGELSLFLRDQRARRKIMPPAFETLRKGLEYGITKAQYGVRLGTTEVVVFRANPYQYTLAPYLESEDLGWAQAPMTVRGWLERIPEASLLLNGGQYYPDRSSMGYLKRDSGELEPRAHKHWKGYVVSLAKDSGLVPFSVMDLEIPRGTESFDNYHNAFQSFMVIDRLGQMRVKDTDHVASRVAIGEDNDGYINIVIVKGAITLRDLAYLLNDLEIFPALSLDGGVETQIAFQRQGSWEYIYGEYSHNAFGNIRLIDYHPSLPLVVALTPITEPSQDTNGQ
jgi:hypothetical protein